MKETVLDSIYKIIDKTIQLQKGYITCSQIKTIVKSFDEIKDKEKISKEILEAMSYYYAVIHSSKEVFYVEYDLCSLTYCIEKHWKDFECIVDNDFEVEGYKYDDIKRYLYTKKKLNALSRNKK